MFKTSKTFENDLSDNHKLVSTIMKPGSLRDPPRKKIQFYKNFNLECFCIALDMALTALRVEYLMNSMKHFLVF